MDNEQSNNIELDAWDDISSFLPKEWRECAQKHGVMKGARQDKSLDDTLRVLLMHLACGYSLKETVARATVGNRKLYSSSHVALRDRLIKFTPFFKEMCTALFDDASNLPLVNGYSLRLIDATDILENGPTGSTWRFHYSLRLPDFCCDFTKLTATHGAGTGENLTQFSFSKGDLVVADRGYSRATGIFHAASQGAKVCIRLNYSMLKLYNTDGKNFELIKKLKTLDKSGQAAEWECELKNPDQTAEEKTLRGRLCAVRLPQDKIMLAHKKLKREAQLHKRKISADTCLVHEYILIFTTFPPDDFPLRSVLQIYRWRWQVELVFKRFKSILRLGHVPTRNDTSTISWLYGKMFVALLAEKISRGTDGSFSPWGKSIYSENIQQSLETLRICRPFIAEYFDTEDFPDKCDQEMV